ncbi:von Willebrand factor type A domain protein, partial [Vibrio parahaemolyticus V-223/04]
SRTCRQS